MRLSINTRVSILGIMMLSVMALIASACQTSSDDNESEIDDNRINVIASMYPLEYFAERIGGDRVNVESLIAPGQDAHDFEPTPGDLRDLAAADVLVYNGLGFESWIDSLLESNEIPSVTVQASPEDIGLHFETTTWNADDDGHDDHADDDDGHDDHADDDDGHDDHADDDDGHDDH
ncbi:MAG: metal ABC transporter substrate-binding protein, partial [Dehalococcoidia bacterium]